MDHYDRIKKLRDEAFDRVEAAKRAIDESSDGRLVRTLDSLLAELEGPTETTVETVPHEPVLEEDLELDQLIAELDRKDPWAPEGGGMAPVAVSEPQPLAPATVTMTDTSDPRIAALDLPYSVARYLETIASEISIACGRTSG